MCRHAAKYVGFVLLSLACWLVLTLLALLVPFQLASISAVFRIWVPAAGVAGAIPAIWCALQLWRMQPKHQPSRRAIVGVFAIVVVILGLSVWPRVHGYVTQGAAARAAEQRFEVVYPRVLPPKQFDPLLAELERAWPGIIRSWGMSPNGPSVRLKLYETLDDLRGRRGVPGWASGQTECAADGPIISLVLETLGGQEAYVSETPRHELVHVAMCLALGDRLFASVPRWFHEGAAQSQEATGPWRWVNQSVNRLNVWLGRGQILAAPQFSAYGFGESKAEAGLFYATAWEFVRELSRRHGSTFLLDVTERTREVGFEAAFGERAGGSCVELYEVWRAGF